MPKLTKRFIDSLRPVEKDSVFWDRELPCFGLRAWPSGKRVFVVQYRAQGRTRKITLGRYGVLTPDEARQRARQVLAEVGGGSDPAERRDAARYAPTVRDLAKRYLSEHAEAKKKPKGVDSDRRLLERFILPSFGTLKAEAVTRADVGRLHHSLRETPYQANRALALLSKMFNLAERWGLRPDGSNPCRHVERFKEHKRERFLSTAELACLGKVLAEAERYEVEPPGAIAAIRLLLFTGCRLSEILTLRWQEVDFERACLRLADSKTGAKVVHLNAPALEVLAGLQREEGNPYVIVGEKPGAHLNDLEAPWRRIREGAGLPDVRLHDLRHSFASVGAGARLGLVIIGKLLGHTQAQTTARYSHLEADPVKQASEVIGQRIAAALKGERAEVVELRGKPIGRK